MKKHVLNISHCCAYVPYQNKSDLNLRHGFGIFKFHFSQTRTNIGKYKVTTLPINHLKNKIIGKA